MSGMKRQQYRAHVLPDLDPAIVEAALGPQLTAELRSLHSEAERQVSIAQAYERRVSDVIHRLVRRALELHAPVEKLQAIVDGHATERPFKVPR